MSSSRLNRGGARRVALRLFVSCLGLLFSLIVLPVTIVQAQNPELPRVFLDTTYPTMTGQTIHVSAGGDLQAAINTANPGDTITLAAGATYTAPNGQESFILPYKSNPNNLWIVIRAVSSAFDAGGLVPPQARVDGMNLNHTNQMPLIRAKVNVPSAIVIASGAHHYRLVGLDIGALDTVNRVTAMISPEESSYTSLETMVSDIVVDRCYVHGEESADPYQRNFRRGIALHGKRMAVIDSYVSNFHDFEQANGDSQAVYGAHGPGPFKIVNNYLEAASENIIFGGDDPRVNGVVPSDIEIRRNRCAKPLRWREQNLPQIKNLFELKNARRVLIDGNIFEYNWAQAQSGTAILFTVRQDGIAPWSVVEDVQFTNNIVRHAARGITITSQNDETYPPTQLTRNIRVHNNLFYDINSNWGTNGGNWLLLIYPGAQNYTFTHNTVDSTTRGITFELQTNPAYNFSINGFVFNDNITRIINGGPSSGSDVGTVTLNYHAGATWTFRRNALVENNRAPEYPPDNPSPPASYEAVGFVNRDGENYRLNASSLYRTLATDGSDIGIDQNAIETAIGLPITPSNLQLDADDLVTFTWTDNSSTEDGFIVEKRRWIYPKNGVPYYKWGIVATLGAGVTSWTSPTYTLYQNSYRVRAFNRSGNSAATNAVRGAVS